MGTGLYADMLWFITTQLSVLEDASIIEFYHYIKCIFLYMYLLLDLQIYALNVFLKAIENIILHLNMYAICGYGPLCRHVMVYNYTVVSP